MCNKAYTGFGAGFIDYDNDGRLDLFIANGAVTLREEQRGSPPPYKEKNLLLHNEGGKFGDVTDGAGSAFRLLEVPVAPPLETLTTTDAWILSSPITTGRRAFC